MHDSRDGEISVRLPASGLSALSLTAYPPTLSRPTTTAFGQGPVSALSMGGVDHTGVCSVILWQPRALSGVEFETFPSVSPHSLCGCDVEIASSRDEGALQTLPGPGAPCSQPGVGLGCPLTAGLPDPARALFSHH